MITQENLHLLVTLIPEELRNTVYMVVVACFVAVIIGLPIGILLVISGKGHIKENVFVHNILGWVVNIGRSVPFAIMMIALIPVTRWIVGTSLGTTASIVPLSIVAIPFFSRMAEDSFRGVDKSLIEASFVMGATPWQIVKKVLLPEALPSLIIGVTTTAVNLVGYSAMAGTMGGGGLGKVAIQYGYQRFNIFLIIVTIVILIVLVQVIQKLGNSYAKKILKKRGLTL